MLKSSFIVLIIFLSIEVHSQKEGDTWVVGYYSLGSPEYSVMYLNFSGPELEIEWHLDEKIRFQETSSSICDAEGEVTLITNGMEIFSKNGVSVADTICFDTAYPGYWDWWYSETYGADGMPELGGALVLPSPAQENEYSVIGHSSKYHEVLGFVVTRYLESRVRKESNGTYTVLYRDSLIEPYLEWYTGPIIATRHANGRDWWIINFEANSSRYFSHLLDPSGIHLYHEGNIDTIVLDGLGQAAFSGFGNYIARMDAITFNIGQFITLYSFDRCNGTMERLETIHTDAGYFTGVAFSPSERYLYADNNSHLWQWDLWSDDIASSQTLVDTFDGFVQPGWFAVRFAPMMTAPDGRIYIVPPSGSSEYMHVITRPDLPADEVEFHQHSINLTKPNGRTAPNIPNFRLGPFDGSDCDTLGLNNHPVSRWRYEKDNPDVYNTIRFTDLSFFNPQNWLWEFDDGSTSNEMSPVHTFENGFYHVCLTVSNEYSSDSSCQWLTIMSTSSDEINDEPRDLSIYPNPFTDKLNINSESGKFRTAHIRLHDMHGKLVFDQPKAPVPVSLVIPSLLPGIYFCTILDGEEVYEFKAMKF